MDLAAGEDILNGNRVADGTSDAQKRRIAYYYDPEIGNYNYGKHHCWKPHRVRIVHHLLVAYDICKEMEMFKPTLIDYKDIMRFHSDDYVNFLRVINPDNASSMIKQQIQFNVGDDSPVFDGLFDYIRSYCSGSIGGACRLNEGISDIVVNWSGGLHHAKKSEASGFCYVNDIVLAILELLKKYTRVLYIDIDIHHGDGVEEAFYTTNRVMTVSFHKFGDFFPGTGDVSDIGYGEGKGYSLNFPLRAGIDDTSFVAIFKPVIAKVMERYQPEAIVLQCGADSLSGDRLGCFNLSLKGHAECVNFVRSFNVPTLVLGGGGYTVRNVSRCWTYETSIILGKEIKNELPFTDYLEYFGPDYSLQITPSNMENMNTQAYLDEHLQKLLHQLQTLEAVPGLQIESSVNPKTPDRVKMEKPEEGDPDEHDEVLKKEAPGEFA
ncbi:hypothetical protein WA171_004538 [Blastocystis sp. BT1]